MTEWAVTYVYRPKHEGSQWEFCLAITAEHPIEWFGNLCEEYPDQGYRFISAIEVPTNVATKWMGKLGGM